MIHAPFVQYKDYDHDDVETDFCADRWLQVASNIMLSVIVFCWLTACIVITLQIPSAWLSWIDLYLWGV